VAMLSMFIHIWSLSFSSGQFFNIYQEVGLTGSILLIFSNFLILGQDLVMFTGVSDGAFGLTSDFSKSDTLVYAGLLVPQAWSLSLELTFYLLAPFILKNRKMLLLLLFASLLTRVLLIYIGLGTEDPFSYRFFPAELCLFILGAFSHQIIYPFYARHKIINNRAISLVTIVSIVCILLFHLIPINRIVLSIVLILYFIMALPLLAHFQKTYYIDDWLGRLSYPIYITHMLVLSVISFIGKRFEFFETASYYVLLFTSVFFISYLLDSLVTIKVKKLSIKIYSQR